MKFKFYTNSEKAWGAMLEAINLAQKSVYLEMYIFASNMGSYDFFDILKQKAQQGLKVKIIVDAFGSSDLEEKTINQARAAGIEILFFNHWLHHTHKKILIIDDRIAFLGGVNIHKSFRLWNDLQIMIQSNRAVKGTLASFSHAYRFCGGKDEEVLAWEKKTFFGKTKIWITEHRKQQIDQQGKKISLKKYYKDKIDNAAENITITTPYFAPHRWMANALRRAIYREVNINIILPRQSDNWLADRANYFYMSKMYKKFGEENKGIIFFLYPNMLHAKAMLVDNTEGIVGSQNLDIFSFAINSEIGMFFQEKQLVAKLTKILNAWKNESVIFDPSVYKPRWFDYLLSPIFKIFHRVL